MNQDLLKQRAKAFNYLFDSVVVTDLQGRIIDWNQGSALLYGYSSEDAIGQHVSMLHVPEDSNDITTKVIAAVQVEGKWSGEIRMLRKDGSIGWIESMCVPVYDEEQQIIGAIGVNRDITEKIHEKERLQHLAHFDHLTNLPNRYVVIDRIEHLIAQSNRDARKFALLFIDLDYFKALNDSNGHAFGDQALIQIASRLKGAIRSSDTAARFGGDEFVILLENISDRQDAIHMVELLYQTLNTKYLIEGQKIHLSSSIGIAVFPDDASTKNDLLNIADKAMYSTKLKNKVFVENPLNRKQ